MTPLFTVQEYVQFAHASTLAMTPGLPALTDAGAEIIGDVTGLTAKMVVNPGGDMLYPSLCMQLRTSGSVVGPAVN